jgi:hypothetical protein
MTRLFIRSMATFSLVFIAHLANAQMTITEYFPLKSVFDVDLKDIKIAKTIFTKGVLDVEWDADNRTLAIAYNPKETDIKAIAKNINKCAGETILTLNEEIFSRKNGK